jgi:hypothetical protein
MALKRAGRVSVILKANLFVLSDIIKPKTERLHFMIQADIESCLVSESGKVGVMVEHVPSGLCAYTVSVDLEFKT